MANQYRSVLASSGPAPTGGDALPAEVLSGKTFTNDNGAQTGTMTNNGAVSENLTFGQSYTIPEGYHNGNGTVTAPNSPSLTFDQPTASPSVNCEVGDIVFFYSTSNTLHSVSGGTILYTPTPGVSNLFYFVRATATTVTLDTAVSYVAVISN